MSTSGTVVEEDGAERVEAVRTGAEEVTKKYDRKYVLRCIAEGRPTSELMKALGDSGLLGVGLPEEFGGSGGGLVAEATLVETIGRAGIQSPFVIGHFSRNLVARHGSPQQRDRFIGRTLSGENVTCFALTEPDAGTNAFALRTKATRATDGSWVISGQKIYISGAGDATQMLLVARTSEPSEDQRTFGLSMFVLDLPQPGIVITPMNTTVTLPERQYTVFFDNVRLPADALVGQEGQAVKSLFSALNPERILASAITVGLGNFVLAKAVEFVRVRAPFGTPIGGYQAIQHMLAKAHIGLEAARSMVYRAAADYDHGNPSGIGANSAKYIASEAGNAAIDAAIQVHGGQAFDYETDVINHLQYMRLQRIAPINNEMILNYIGEQVLRLPRSY